MNTIEGGKKMRVTIIERHGPDFWKRVGKLGGEAPKSKPSGFAAMPPEIVSAAGRKGYKNGMGKKRAAKQAGSII